MAASRTTIARSLERMAIHPLAMPNLFGFFYAVGGYALQPPQVTMTVAALSTCAVLWTMHLSRTLVQDSAGLLWLYSAACSSLITCICMTSLCCLCRWHCCAPVWRCTQAWPPMRLQFLLFHSGSRALFLLAIPVMLLLCLGWMRRVKHTTPVTLLSSQTA